MKNKKNIIRLIAEFFFIYLLFIILSILPINFVSHLGGLIFKYFGPLTKYHKIACNNYLNIFPTSNLLEIKNTVHKSWENFGKTLFELLILRKIIDKKNNKIIIKGKEYLDELKIKNEQVIFFGIHQSNWEILLPTIDSLGFKVGGIYRHINNPYIDKFILNQRSKSIPSKKSFYTPKGKRGAKKIINAVNKKFSIVLLIDQKDSAGENIKFFNFQTKTQTGFLKVARKHNMKLVPVENSRQNINNFTLKFYPPLSYIKSDLSDIKIMEEIHAIIENWIKKDPKNWFLQHNRFN